MKNIKFHEQKLKDKIYSEESVLDKGEQWREKLKYLNYFADEHGNVNSNLINQDFIYDDYNYIYTDQSSDSD